MYTREKGTHGRADGREKANGEGITLDCMRHFCVGLASQVYKAMLSSFSCLIMGEANVSKT